jgi:hypothetical protein
MTIRKSQNRLQPIATGSPPLGGRPNQDNLADY